MDLFICLFWYILLQLKERDARGYTPFMTAVQCHNFKAAMYILDFVESNKGRVVALRNVDYTLLLEPCITTALP